MPGLSKRTKCGTSNFSSGVVQSKNRTSAKLEGFQYIKISTTENEILLWHATEMKDSMAK